MTSKYELSKSLEISFKKLKSSIYYDKTQLVFRDKLVDYEVNIFESLKNLEKALNSSDLKWKKYEQKLLSSITYLTFPKSLKNNSSSSNSNNIEIFSNESECYPIIDKVQYMIDCDVDIQILGVLWILTVGINLDKALSDSVYGNRIKPSVINEFENPTYSPHLLKPYFTQYQTWRDTGLQIAEDYMDKGKDVLIITLDLKSFYNSITFSKKHFEMIDEEIINHNDYFIKTEIVKRLNMFIYNVISTYKDLKKESISLPIGFLPSNILSNWYLSKFDAAIFTKINPIYYGRYVDDIIIVDKIEKNSFLYQEKVKKNVTGNSIINTYLCNCKSSPARKCPNDNGIFLNIESVLRINNKYLLEGADDEILVQNNKVKTFYFSANGPKALLKSFRDAVNKNRSEFRFMPKEDGYLNYGDYTNIYEIIKSKNSSVHKFREISDIEINKFNLSKFLGRLSTITTLTDDKKENKFQTDILKIFSQDKIIENYIFIEIVIQQLLINEHYDTCISFIEKTLNSIDNIEFIKNNKINIKTTIMIKESIYKHLLSSVHRSSSLIWGEKIANFLNSFVKLYNYESKKIKTKKISIDSINSKRKLYIRTKMINKHAIPCLIDAIPDNIFDSISKKTYNLTKFSHILDIVTPKKLAKYRFYPYIVRLQDIEIYNYIQRFIEKRTGLRSFQVLEKCKKTYTELNYPNIEKSLPHSALKNIETKKLEYNNINDSYITISKVKNEIKEKLSVAIANTILYERDFENVLLGKPNRSFQKYKRIQKIVDNAILESADILIMPECYVPFEWLQLLAQKSAQNKLIIITGVEHLRLKNKNLKTNTVNLTATILPYSVDENTISSHIHLRNKVHYSPEEIRIIKGYNSNFVKGNDYDIFSYNGFIFSVYCCFELASIQDRSLFSNIVDATIAVEWNKDTKYYSNIIESLSRDLHCFCVQVNTSNFGDSRIISPTESIRKDIVQIKGGKNDCILIGDIDIKALRDFQLKEFELQKDDKRFKPTPPHFNKSLVKSKIDGTIIAKIASRKQ